MKYTLRLLILIVLFALGEGGYLPLTKPVSAFSPTKNFDGGSTYLKINPNNHKSKEKATQTASVTISGRVFQDANGMTDGTVNGQPSSSIKNLPPAEPNQLYILINHPCRNGCYQLQAVAADGTYSFQVDPNTTYTLYIADFVGCIEDCVLSTNIAKSTGEHIGNGPGSDGTPDSKIIVEVGANSVTEVNFGYDYLPIPTRAIANPQPNPLGNNQVLVPTLTGVDREDGYYSGISNTNTIRLYLYVADHYGNPELGDFASGPNYSTLYYNGLPVTDGQVILNYDPTKLTVDPVDGNVTVQFSFSQLDAAGLQASRPVTVTMPFSDTVTQLDFGDAPAVFFTNLNGANGPRHVIVDGLRIGTLIDAEADGQLIVAGPLLDYSATADDIAGQDDEDGIIGFPPLLALQTSYNLPVNVTNTTGASATLSGWIDFNMDRVFSENERTQVTVPSGATSVTLSWANITWTSRAFGDTYVRLRLASLASEVATTRGQASSGEVEDYKFYIQEPPLPVGLTHFEGQWIEGIGNQLRWNTAWEKNNDHFDIQVSTNAISFETIGRVTGQGTITEAQNYTFVDTRPQANIAYYRLKQVEMNSSFNYSQIISVKSGLESQAVRIVAYPNPASDFLQLKLSKPTVVVETNIYSITGVHSIHQPSSILLINVNLLPPGMYIVEVIMDNDKALYQRFVKK